MKNLRMNLTLKMDITELSKLAIIADKKLTRSPLLAEKIITEYIERYEAENGEIKIE